MFTLEALDRARRILDACKAASLKLATAESCSGGLIAGCLTSIAGSSAVMERGFVTYTDQAKTELLGVPKDLLGSRGEVSEEVARAMAEGAIAHSPADIAIACTGIAGPTGGTKDKPIGLVHLAAARTGRPTLHLKRSYGVRTREAVRLEAVDDALGLLLEQAQS